MFQTTPCGYYKLVSWEAWLPDTAKGFSSIQTSCPEKTLKKWSDIAHLSVELNVSIFRYILGVFLAQDARINLIPFAEYQAPWDTSLEYPHGVVWNILNINFFKNWPPLGDPSNPFSRKIKNFPLILIRYTGKKTLAVSLLKLFGNLTQPRGGTPHILSWLGELLGWGKSIYMKGGHRI